MSFSPGWSAGMQGATRMTSMDVADMTWKQAVVLLIINILRKAI